MRSARLLSATNLVLSVLALVTSTAAIVLHYADRPSAGAVLTDAPADPGAPTDPMRPRDAPLPTAEVAARCLPSVVNVSSTRMVRADSAQNPFFDVFRQFFGLGEPAPHEAQSLGSGVIVSATAWC